MSSLGFYMYSVFCAWSFISFRSRAVSPALSLCNDFMPAWREKPAEVKSSAWLADAAEGHPQRCHLPSERPLTPSFPPFQTCASPQPSPC